MKIENPCLSWFNNLQPIALRQTDACRLPARRRAGDPRPPKKKKNVVLRLASVLYPANTKGPLILGYSHCSLLRSKPFIYVEHLEVSAANFPSNSRKCYCRRWAYFLCRCRLSPITQIGSGAFFFEERSKALK